MSGSADAVDDHPVSPMPAEQIAVLASRAGRARLGEVGALPWVDTLAGHGWRAVRTGAARNDLNGVLSNPGIVPAAAALAKLSEWFGDLPAAWHVERPESGLTDALVEAGWQPERGARCAGRVLPLGRTATVGVRLTRQVTDDRDLQAWLEVARACGWFEGSAAEWSLHERLARELVWPRWVAELDGAIVGIATGWRGDNVVELVDIAVLEHARRRGIGTALLTEVCTWGADAGHVVGEPSPEGWALLRAHGFVNVPTVPDTIFYRAQ